MSLLQTPHEQTKDSRSKFVSVKDLFDRRGTKTHKYMSKVPLEDATYVVPSYSWTRPKYHENREKRLGYLYVFFDPKDATPEQLNKVFPKRKLGVPGPTAYDLVRNWKKAGESDAEKQKGKQYRHDRETFTAEIVRTTKRARTPAPNSYKA